MAALPPLQNKLVTVFGGAGFIGRHLAQDLLDRGARLRIASRNPEKGFSLKPLANLGQIQFARCNVKDERSVRACVEGSHAVVNLVGAFDGDLGTLMGDGAGFIARAARATGARAMVQVSAIGADAHSESAYAQAKALGEEEVREAFPEATIIRPSVLFGPDGGITDLFAPLISAFPVLPVFAPEAQLQLVHVDDVAEAIATALADPARHGGETYELGGPEKITMMALNRRIAEAQRRKRVFAPLPDGASSAFAALPFTPLGRDQWIMLRDGNVVSGDRPGFDRLGIEPRPLGLYLDRMMVRYRKRGRFSENDEYREGMRPVR